MRQRLNLNKYSPVLLNFYDRPHPRSLNTTRNYLQPVHNETVNPTSLPNLNILLKHFSIPHPAHRTALVTVSFIKSASNWFPITFLHTRVITRTPRCAALSSPISTRSTRRKKKPNDTYTKKKTYIVTTHHPQCGCATLHSKSAIRAAMQETRVITHLFPDVIPAARGERPITSVHAHTDSVLTSHTYVYIILTLTGTHTDELAWYYKEPSLGAPLIGSRLINARLE